MDRLTHERVNDIKTGYWSPAKKEELVQRLAEYENTGLEPEEIGRQRGALGWIPVEERLPDEKEFLKSYRRNRYAAEFIVMIEGATLPTTLYFRDGVWADEENNHYRVIAWKPLPEPYRPDGRIYETDSKVSGE